MVSCPNCGKNTPDGKFCEKCGASLQTQKGEISEKVTLVFQFQEKILKKKEELKTAKSYEGPLILGILGILTLGIYVGIILIIVAVIWFEIRYAARPKIQQELTLLETQLKEFEKI